MLRKILMDAQSIKASQGKEERAFTISMQIRKRKSILWEKFNSGKAEKHKTSREFQAASTSWYKRRCRSQSSTIDSVCTASLFSVMLEIKDHSTWMSCKETRESVAWVGIKRTGQLCDFLTNRSTCSYKWVSWGQHVPRLLLNHLEMKWSLALRQSLLLWPKSHRNGIPQRSGSGWPRLTSSEWNMSSAGQAGVLSGDRALFRNIWKKLDIIELPWLFYFWKKREIYLKIKGRWLKEDKIFLELSALGGSREVKVDIVILVLKFYCRLWQNWLP